MEPPCIWESTKDFYEVRNCLQKHFQNNLVFRAK